MIRWDGVGYGRVSLWVRVRFGAVGWGYVRAKVGWGRCKG